MATTQGGIYETKNQTAKLMFVIFLDYYIFTEVGKRTSSRLF